MQSLKTMEGPLQCIISCIILCT